MLFSTLNSPSLLGKLHSHVRGYLPEKQNAVEAKSINKNSEELKRPLTILVAGLDTIKQKNLYQLKGLNIYGHCFIVLTNDSLGNSQSVVGLANNIQLHVASSRWLRVSTIFCLIRTLLTKNIDLAEVYPYDWLQLIIAVLLKLARIPVILVARGPEYRYITNKMSRKQRIAFRWTYSVAQHIIYKELYMKDLFLEFRKENFYMLHNAIIVPNHVNPLRTDRCYFLYMNSMKFFRHPEIILKAFLDICQELHLSRKSHIRLIIAGFMGGRASDAAKRKEDELRALIAGKDVPVELHPWTNNPVEWLDKADVFLLPADIVYLNYSLLEAMGRGVPPIVQNGEGAELIIDHGVDGFILPKDPDIWKEYMHKLIENPSLRGRLGLAARKKVLEKFSLNEYLERYNAIYQKVCDSK